MKDPRPTPTRAPVTIRPLRPEDAAADLLWGAIASGVAGATVSYDFVTAQNQWAARPMR